MFLILNLCSNTLARQSLGENTITGQKKKIHLCYTVIGNNQIDKYIHTYVQ